MRKSKEIPSCSENQYHLNYLTHLTSFITMEASTIFVICLHDSRISGYIVLACSQDQKT